MRYGKRVHTTAADDTWRISGAAGRHLGTIDQQPDYYVTRTNQQSPDRSRKTILSALRLYWKNKLGQAIMAPIDVYLDRKSAYQPDIIFIANENLHKLQEDGFKAPRIW